MFEISNPAQKQYWTILREDGSFDIGETESNQVTTSGAKRFEYGNSFKEITVKFTSAEVRKLELAIIQKEHDKQPPAGDRGLAGAVGSNTIMATDYLLIATNQAGSNNESTLIIDWYEHTDKG